jgi:hypothetical protein
MGYFQLLMSLFPLDNVLKSRLPSALHAHKLPAYWLQRTSLAAQPTCTNPDVALLQYTLLNQPRPRHAGRKGGQRKNPADVPRKRNSTNCTEVRVGLGTNMDRREKSSTHWGSNPEPTSP